MEEVDHEVTVQINELDLFCCEFMPLLTRKAMEDMELLFGAYMLLVPVNYVVMLVRVDDSVADPGTKELEDDEVMSVSPM